MTENKCGSGATAEVFVDELQIIKRFILEKKRERYSEFVVATKKREKFLRELYHFDDFDPDVIVRLPGKSETIEEILKELRARGAKDDCYIISCDKELDRMTLPLVDALQRVFARIEGTIISCGPTVAYYEGEAPNNRFILNKRKV